MADFCYTNVRVWGDALLVRGYTPKGDRYHERFLYQPTLFVESDNVISPYRSITGAALEPRGIRTMGAARAFIDQMTQINRPVWGLENFALAYISENWPVPSYPEKDDLIVANVDIEVDSSKGFPHPDKAEHEVTGITVQWGNKFAVFGMVDYKPSDPRVTYIRCDSEFSLLSRFVRFWRRLDPDIMTGWNISSFDVPYIVNRCVRVLGGPQTNQLSPWGIVLAREVAAEMGRRYNTYDIFGVSIVDYLSAYKKFRLKKQESYRLDYIGHAELGMGKIDYSEYGKLQDLMSGDFRVEQEEVVSRGSIRHMGKLRTAIRDYLKK